MDVKVIPGGWAFTVVSGVELLPGFSGACG
jgi:hypothetical protein